MEWVCNVGYEMFPWVSGAAAMLIGPVGTAMLPKTVFGLFERFGTFSVVVFNAVLGISLMKGTLYFPAVGEKK